MGLVESLEVSGGITNVKVDRENTRGVVRVGAVACRNQRATRQRI